MEENLIKKPAYSEKNHIPAGEKKIEKLKKEEERDFYEEKPNSINFQESKEYLKPQVFSVPGLSKVVEQNNNKNEIEEQNFDEKKAEEWVDKWLPEDVIDAYALSYEKSKKPPREKRKNKKYQKYYQKGQEEIKKHLQSRLSSQILSGKTKENTSNERVKEIILKMLKSDLRATRLVKIIENYNYKEKQTPKDSATTFNKNTKTETPESKSFSKETIEDKEEVLIVAQAGVPDDPDDKKPNSNKKEAPKTKSDFFNQYSSENVYVNSKDGSDLSILDYDDENQEVLVYQYQSFVYNKETESWGSSKKRGQEKKIKYDDFLDLMKDYVLDQDSDQDYENKLENGNLKGFYINNKGEFFKLKNYFKRKNAEGKLENFVKIEVSKKTRADGEVVMKTEDYHDFIKKGRFDFYNNGKEMEEAFNKKIERIKGEIKSFEIQSFSYNSGEDKYLIKIKEPDQSARFISFKELQKLALEEKENLKNSNEKKELNEVESKIFKIFKIEVKAYREGVYKKTQENLLLNENTRNLIVKDYVKNYLEERLPKRIKEKVDQYKILDVDQMLILDEFKKEFSF
jgi:hypothetical protein